MRKIKILWQGKPCRFYPLDVFFGAKSDQKRRCWQAADPAEQGTDTSCLLWRFSVQSRTHHAAF